MNGINRREFLSRLGVSAATTAMVGTGAARVAAATLETERTFRPSTEVFANPERGFYSQRRSDRMERLDDLRRQGISLLLVTFDLRDFRERDLTDEKLAELERALGVARQGGFKVVFRAAYGFTGQDYRVDPHDLARIRGHIRQMGAVLAAGADVLGGIQAGMLGPWGEWHGSNHGNPPSLEARRAVLFGWLDAVPAPITVHIRRPMFIRDIFATEPGGNALMAETAFNGSRLSRTGWHNDAFLVPPTDMGTYAERGWDRERELQWCSQHGRFTPFGGETVHRDPLMPIDAMIREMELLHATYLNIGYHRRVIQYWQESEFRGENAFQHIARRLGYRLVAAKLRHAKILRRGGRFGFELALRNTGFASLHLPRVVEWGLLPRDGTRPVARLAPREADPRRWGPEAGLVSLAGELPVPADVAAGHYRLGLRMGDPAPRLREDGRFAIRLANDEVPFSADGWNVLTDDIACD